MELGIVGLSSIEVTVVGTVLAIAILVFGGLVKGTVGFITISGLVQIFPPKLTLVALSIPFLISNIVVLVRDGVPMAFLRE